MITLSEQELALRARKTSLFAKDSFIKTTHTRGGNFAVIAESINGGCIMNLGNYHYLGLAMSNFKRCSEGN